MCGSRWNPELNCEGFLSAPSSLVHPLPSTQLTSNIQGEVFEICLGSTQRPPVLPCVDALSVCDHQPGLASLNLKPPRIINVASWRHLIEDDASLSIGSQLNGDISEGVGDVTGHHHTVSCVYSHLMLGAIEVVPVCVESILFRL